MFCRYQDFLLLKIHELFWIKEVATFSHFVLHKCFLDSIGGANLLLFEISSNFKYTGIFGLSIQRPRSCMSLTICYPWFHEVSGHTWCQLEDSIGFLLRSRDIFSLVEAQLLLLSLNYFI